MSVRSISLLLPASFVVEDNFYHRIPQFWLNINPPTINEINIILNWVNTNYPNQLTSSQLSTVNTALENTDPKTNQTHRREAWKILKREIIKLARVHGSSPKSDAKDWMIQEMKKEVVKKTPDTFERIPDDRQQNLIAKGRTATSAEPSVFIPQNLDQVPDMFTPNRMDAYFEDFRRTSRTESNSLIISIRFTATGILSDDGFKISSSVEKHTKNTLYLEIHKNSEGEYSLTQIRGHKYQETLEKIRKRSTLIHIWDNWLIIPRQKATEADLKNLSEKQLNAVFERYGVYAPGHANNSTSIELAVRMKNAGASYIGIARFHSPTNINEGEMIRITMTRLADGSLVVTPKKNHKNYKKLAGLLMENPLFSKATLVDPTELARSTPTLNEGILIPNNLDQVVQLFTEENLKKYHETLRNQGELPEEFVIRYRQTRGDEVTGFQIQRVGEEVINVDNTYLIVKKIGDTYTITEVYGNQSVHIANQIRERIRNELLNNVEVFPNWIIMTSKNAAYSIIATLENLESITKNQLDFLFEKHGKKGANDNTKVIEFSYHDAPSRRESANDLGIIEFNYKEQGEDPRDRRVKANIIEKTESNGSKTYTVEQIGDSPKAKALSSALTKSIEKLAAAAAEVDISPQPEEEPQPKKSDRYFIPTHYDQIHNAFTKENLAKYLEHLRQQDASIKEFVVSFSIKKRSKSRDVIQDYNVSIPKNASFGENNRVSYYRIKEKNGEFVIVEATGLRASETIGKLRKKLLGINIYPDWILTRFNIGAVGVTENNLKNLTLEQLEYLVTRLRNGTTSPERQLTHFDFLQKTTGQGELRKLNIRVDSQPPLKSTTGTISILHGYLDGRFFVEISSVNGYGTGYSKLSPGKHDPIGAVLKSPAFKGSVSAELFETREWWFRGQMPNVEELGKITHKELNLLLKYQREINQNPKTNEVIIKFKPSAKKENLAHLNIEGKNLDKPDHLHEILVFEQKADGTFKLSSKSDISTETEAQLDTFNENKIPEIRRDYFIPENIDQVYEVFTKKNLEEYLKHLKKSDAKINEFIISYAIQSSGEQKNNIYSFKIEKPDEVNFGKNRDLSYFRIIKKDGQFILAEIHGRKTSRIVEEVRKNQDGVVTYPDWILTRFNKNTAGLNEQDLRNLTTDQLEFLVNRSREGLDSTSTEVKRTIFGFYGNSKTGSDNLRTLRIHPQETYTGSPGLSGTIVIEHGYTTSGEFYAEVVDATRYAAKTDDRTNDDPIEYLMSSNALKGSLSEQLYHTRAGWIKKLIPDYKELKSLNQTELDLLLEYQKLLTKKTSSTEVVISFKITQAGRISDIDLITPADKVGSKRDLLVFTKNADGTYTVNPQSRDGASGTHKKSLKDKFIEIIRSFSEERGIKVDKRLEDTLKPITDTRHRSSSRRPKKPRSTRPKAHKIPTKSKSKPTLPKIDIDNPKFEGIEDKLRQPLDENHIKEGKKLLLEDKSASDFSAKRIAEFILENANNLSNSDESFLERIRRASPSQITDTRKERIAKIARRANLTDDVTVAEYLTYKNKKRTSPTAKPSKTPPPNSRKGRGKSGSGGFIIIPTGNPGFTLSDEIKTLINELPIEEREKFLESTRLFGRSIRSALGDVANEIDFNALMTEILRASNRNRPYSVTIIDPSGGERQLSGTFDELRDELIIARSNGCKIESTNPLFMLSISHPNLFKRIKTLFISEMLGTPVLMQTLVGKVGIGGLNFMVADIISEIAVGDWRQVSAKHALTTWFIMGYTGAVISNAVNGSFRIYENLVFEKQGEAAFKALLKDKNYVFIKHQVVRLFSTLFGLLVMQAIESGDADLMTSMGQIIKTFIPAHLMTAGIMRILSQVIKGFKASSGLGIALSSIIDFTIFKILDKAYIAYDHHQEEENILDQTSPSLTHLRDGGSLNLANIHQIEILPKQLDFNTMTHLEVYPKVMELAQTLEKINPHRLGYSLSVLLREPKGIEEEWNDVKKKRLTSNARAHQEDQEYALRLRRSQDQAYQRMKAYLRVSPKIKELNQEIEKQIGILQAEGREHEALMIQNQLATMWIGIDNACFSASYSIIDEEAIKARERMQLSSQYGKYQQRIQELETKELENFRKNPEEFKDLVAQIFFGIDQSDPRYHEVIQAMNQHGILLANPTIREKLFDDKEGSLKEVEILRKRIKKDEIDTQNEIDALLARLNLINLTQPQKLQGMVRQDTIMKRAQELKAYQSRKEELRDQIANKQRQLVEIRTRNQQIEADLERDVELRNHQARYRQINYPAIEEDIYTYQGYQTALSRLDPDTIFAIRKDAREEAILDIFKAMNLRSLYENYQNQNSNISSYQLITEIAENHLSIEKQEELRLALINTPYFTEELLEIEEDKPFGILQLFGQHIEELPTLFSGIKDYTKSESINQPLGLGLIRETTPTEAQNAFQDKGNLNLPPIHQEAIINLDPTKRRAFFKLIASKAKQKYDPIQSGDIHILISLINEK